jgi:hypothetical protein
LSSAGYSPHSTCTSEPDNPGDRAGRGFQVIEKNVELLNDGG